MDLALKGYLIPDGGGRFLTFLFLKTFQQNKTLLLIKVGALSFGFLKQIWERSLQR